MKRILPLVVIPALQVACFVGCGLAFPGHPWLALGLLALAAIALDFDVHVFLHECVHATAPERTPWAVSLGLTLLGGLPFDGYRLHHYNHHRHDNGPEDFSSTWKWEADGCRRAKGLTAYVLGWPAELARARAAMREDAAAGRLSPGLQRRLRVKKHLVAACLLALALVSWHWAVAYATMVYFGWGLVSLHNYGQHLPAEGQGFVTSFAPPWYNFLLFNNGLHGEHHDQPGKAWFELRADPKHAPAGAPPLVAPFLPANRRRVAVDARSGTRP